MLLPRAERPRPTRPQKRLANVKNVAMDAVFDSVSIATTFKEELSKAGVVFCSISEAVREMPDLVRKHLGSVVRVNVLAFISNNHPTACQESRAALPPLPSRASSASACKTAAIPTMTPSP